MLSFLSCYHSHSRQPLHHLFLGRCTHDSFHLCPAAVEVHLRRNEENVVLAEEVLVVSLSSIKTLHLPSYSAASSSSVGVMFLQAQTLPTKPASVGLPLARASSRSAELPEPARFLGTCRRQQHHRHECSQHENNSSHCQVPHTAGCIALQWPVCIPHVPLLGWRSTVSLAAITSGFAQDTFSRSRTGFRAAAAAGTLSGGTSLLGLSGK